MLIAWCAVAAQAQDALPQRLSDTGLDAAQVMSFTPQYPLWSDGAAKRRWIALPPGSTIDATRPDDWQFPPGTKLWKEFAIGGKPVETRYIERTAGGRWRYATYLWNERGDDAQLAPERGIAALPVAGAPGGRYAVPSRGDCIACHGGAQKVLGFSALQLSPARDTPQRPGDVDLRSLAARGWLRGLPAALLEAPPRIAADTPLERAALGYLHANCGHCHNATGTQVPVRLTLMQRVDDPRASRDDALRSMLEASRYRPPRFGDEARSVVAGDADHSVLAARMASRDPRVQMPPLGTQVPDAQGLALVAQWINQLSPSSQEPQR
jgi:mono/diheme cytochrome c family protein